MVLSLKNIGKRYSYNWIFRNIDFEFTSDHTYAITGPNGSGKSTLLRIISSSLSPSEGAIQWHKQQNNIEIEEVPFQITVAAPYQELIEELTLEEFLNFHRKFKNFLPGFSVEKTIGELNFNKEKNKEIKYFSSGMKQRLRLVLAFFFDSKMILLDEPVSNLDAEGKTWYKHLVQNYLNGRTLIVCSNHKEEYDFCEEVLELERYK